ncbi:MAG TPA: response regulator transcription factor, partial [Candidatus Dormibacteraeota bacterium]|nr:response regulator transcription factor [Candidatus Dormibacteraeota bacterium]
MQVAVADDSVLFREGLARLLEGAGMQVTSRAADAKELLAAVDAVQPDIVITDIRMPPSHTTEGLVAAAEIRERHPKVAVMLLSQY